MELRVSINVRRLVLLSIIYGHVCRDRALGGDARVRRGILNFMAEDRGFYQKLGKSKQYGIYNIQGVDTLRANCERCISSSSSSLNLASKARLRTCMTMMLTSI